MFIPIIVYNQLFYTQYAISGRSLINISRVVCAHMKLVTHVESKLHYIDDSIVREEHNIDLCFFHEKLLFGQFLSLITLD